MRTLITADVVLPDADSALEPGAVLVKDERIAWVGRPIAAPEADATIELGEAVLTPGLVNAHTHLDLTHLRGAIPFEGDFAGWLEKVKDGRDRPGVAEAALWGIKEALARGTTAFGDFVTAGAFDAVVGALAETGARARLFIEAIGFKPGAADRVFERVWELAEMRPLPPNVASGLAPHSPYAASRELVSKLVAVADGHERPLAVHVAETLEELAFLRHGIGPLRELLKRLSADDPAHVPYGSLVGFLELLDLQRAPLLLVHCNYQRPRELPAGAFVVYCPTAHAFFGHPEHPVLELLEEGVRVVLGSDSAVSGESVDVLSETQHLARKRPDLSDRAVFRMATEWGARALALDAGTIAVGKLADLAAFTPGAGHQILGRDDAQCVLTMVGGRIMHRAEEEE